MEEHVASFITADTTSFRVFTSEILECLFVFFHETLWCTRLIKNKTSFRVLPSEIVEVCFSRDLLVYSADQKSGHERHNDGKL